MARTSRRTNSNKRKRNVSVRAVRRSHPDSQQLSRALVNFALEQAAQEAAAEAEQRQRREVDHE